MLVKLGDVCHCLNIFHLRARFVASHKQTAIYAETENADFWSSGFHGNLTNMCKALQADIKKNGLRGRKRG